MVVIFVWDNCSNGKILDIDIQELSFDEDV